MRFLIAARITLSDEIERKIIRLFALGMSYQIKAVYTVLALNLEGKKEVLDLYLSESEDANFWLSVLSDLQNRGVEDILIACLDGLTGLPEAINSIYPQTEVQLCVIHQIRNTIKYVASKHHKDFMTDMKPV